MKKQIQMEGNEDLFTHTICSGKMWRSVSNMSGGEWKQVSGCVSGEQKGKRPTYHSGMSALVNQPH
jgi:hypothetical protein